MIVSGGIQAWVTSAVQDKVVDKAIVLATSLRHVRTAKKMVVFTTLAVSKNLREKLKEVFDLVVYLEKETPNGLSLEDFAKVEGLSLTFFNKCVYLSPDALVLKNCDEIFEKYSKFAVLGNGNEVDPSIFVFVPSLDHSRALKQFLHYVDVAGEKSKDFATYFNLWLKNNAVDCDKLATKYNLRVDLINCSRKSMEVDITIANFSGMHPLDMSKELCLTKLNQLGSVEKFAVERCLEIFVDVTSSSCSLQGEYLVSKEHYQNEPIAIVGMSFRLPGGNSPDEFWNLLINGQEGIQVLPPFRWTSDHSIIPCKNRKTEAGFLNVPIDEFDAKFFGISPKEAVFLDPQQRLLHEVSWEALEDAMIDPHTLHGSQTGIFVGSWIHDYKDVAVRSSDVDFFRVYMGNSIASGAARLSHFFGTTGPSIATESGCSSAIVAVHMACKSLQNKESNVALACGVNLFVHPFDMNTLSFVVAPDSRCKTFDANADGFGRAEACAVLTMKRYSDAIKDGDNIWGLIRGSAVTQEGVSKSLGTPTVHCESLSMELAMRDANVGPTDISYVEAHGTGTPVGDPMEIAAITKAYSKGRKEPLIIGSVKTNVGHTESVSGITGIIKVLLSMRNEIIPPHLNLKTLNPDINLDVIPAEIPLSAVPWPRQLKPRLAGVSSFGISGTDGHAIIQEAPVIKQTKIDFQMERPLHIMKISAKCQESLDELLQKYESIFSERANDEDESESDFADMAYSANFGRSTFNHRAILVAKNFTDASKIIREKKYKHADVQSTGSQLCFLFTGQGSQYPNMAATLYATSPIFKDNFDKCSEVLKQRYNISINDVLWGNPDNGTELSRTLYSQTSIFCVEYCLLKLWESWGVKPDYVMGHSLGEFAAAVAAQAITFDDALMLVAERSRLIDNLPRGKMLVIKADKKTVDQTIAKYKETKPKLWVDYAALNSSDQTVVAGDSDLIEDFAKYCGEMSLKTIVLAATQAFHSRHMDPMLQAYKKVASTVTRPQVQNDAPKYISGMEGKLINAEAIDADYWVRHTREKVSFIDACKVAQEEGCTLFLEVGPHPVLSALAMMNIDGKSVTCFPSIRRKEDEWTTLLESLSKLFLSEWKGEIDWKAFDKFYGRSRVAVPFYQFNRKSVWVKTTKVFNDIHPLLGKLIPNASGLSLFEQNVTLKKASFAQDHVIGNTVVFPGAGFLEICLAGGHSSVQGFGDNMLLPRRPVVVKELKIKAPLALLDSQICIIQTVVMLDDKDEEELGYNVNISRLEDPDSAGGGKWIPHVSAKFLPVARNLPAEIREIDIPSIHESWEKTDNKSFYERLPEVGLRFGPKFQSLQGGWKSEDGVLLQVKVPEDTEPFMVHPVIADAMIQAVMLWSSKDTDKVKKKLQVPVQIGTFIWLDAPISTEQYIYSTNNTDGIVYSLLVDGRGTPLAYMSSIDFMETTVKLVEGMIYHQGIGLPQLWEEIWKPKIGPMQRRYEIVPPEPVAEQLSKRLDDINNISEDEKSLYAALCSLSNTFILNALYKLGWNPSSGQDFTVDALIESLSIQKRFAQYLRFFLKRLSNDGFLTMLNEGNLFRVNESIPKFDQMPDIFNEFRKSNYVDRTEFRFMYEIGENLDSVFTGKTEVLTYFFPTDPTKPHVEQFYEALSPHVQPMIYELQNNYFIPCMLRSQTNNKTEERGVVRMMEVGAGTGAFTKRYLSRFIEGGLDVEFYYTDISAAFFGPAEKNLEEYKKHIVFKKFNMEEDPFQQGFVPEYFDIIIACEVIHIAKKINPVLQHLRSLLKPRGSLQFYETTSQDPRNTFLFGLLEGYWQFQDQDLRPDHITLSPEEWKKALLSNGFFAVACFPTYNNVHTFMVAGASEYKLDEKELVKYRPPEVSWLIFTDDNSEMVQCLEKKLLALNRKVHLAKRPPGATEEQMEIFMKKCISDASTDVKQIEGILYLWGLANKTRDQSQISLPLVTLFKNVIMLEKTPKVCVVTQGATTFDGSAAKNPSLGTLVGLVRAARNENISMKISLLDLSPEEPLIGQVDETFYNLWADNDGLVTFSEGKRFVPKMASYKASNDYLSIPSGCDRFRLVLPASRVISDLEFSYLEPYVLTGTEIEVQVKTTALNFRDVFTVIKPIPLFEDLNSVGLDIAGKVTRVGPNVTKLTVGDRVIGMNMHNDMALPSHILLEEDRVVRLPTEMTFMEGVTLPAVFSTAIYCLINIARMKSNDTVLIHTASGGVGLCAIQLAKHIGANIIATAGSTRKRNFLRNLGIQHVFHSRKTDFGKQILEVTNGKGVDIVLNSITGPGFKEASLEALAKNGRFIEMSKLNTWKEEEVQELRPDVFYKVVDLTTLEREQYEELSNTLRQFLEKKSIKPIPYERFDALNIRGALNYLQKAKHIGKIVCVLPEVKVEKSKLISTTPLFNDETTYLVTGGLGGIGFEVVKWMLENGAKHIAIASRSSPKPEIAALINRWNKTGKHVEAFSVDVGNFEHCKQMFEELKAPERGFPRLRGIMHAAGVLEDATLENQNWEKFSLTYNPKVYGTWNLHDLTKDMLLEHFVLFSSIAAPLGSPGQPNHSASNSFEDTFCHYRNSIGLPCLSVNWGNWGEVGVATEIDLPGLRPISTKQGLVTLETLMTVQKVRTFAWNVDSFTMMSKLFPSIKSYVDDQRLLGETKVLITINSDEFWAMIDNAQTREEKADVFKNFIKSTVRITLKMDEDEQIDDNTDFQVLGIDSLMMLEMKNALQNVLGNRLTLTAAQLKDCNNTAVLGNRLVDILEEKIEADSIPTLDELRALIREDSILPDTIQVDGSLKRKDISEVETVLLTGVTGTLGPYLLRDLTSRMQIKKVYCLIRKSGVRSPLERLEARLNHVKIFDEVNMKKVECIEGDITSATLGLSEEDYNMLAENVDVIVHSAVRSDHNAKYWKVPVSYKQHIRTVNVIGTKHILEFASTKIFKHVYHASTFLTVIAASDSDGRISEDWQDVGTFDQVTVNLGYILSKHISEQLVKQAIERGIPCKAFRFPGIAGDSKTGRFDFEMNHVALRWLVSMKLGCMPDVVTPLLLVPVDHCAKLSLSVFFDQRSLSDVYNICMKDYTSMDQTLIEVAKDFDIKVEPVPIETFMEKLKQENEDSPLAPFKQRYMEESANLQGNIDILSTGNGIHKFIENSYRFFESRKLLTLNPNYEDELEPTQVVMKRDLQYLFDLGVFQKFGIKK